MPDASRFVFHGHAAALSGRIVRVGEGTKAKFVKNAFIDLPAAALPAAGGRSTARLSRKQLTDATVRSFVRFESFCTPIGFGLVDSDAILVAT
jgi:hypothetical protein